MPSLEETLKKKKKTFDVWQYGLLSWYNFIITKQISDRSYYKTIQNINLHLYIDYFNSYHPFSHFKWRANSYEKIVKLLFFLSFLIFFQHIFMFIWATPDKSFNIIVSATADFYSSLNIIFIKLIIIIFSLTHLNLIFFCLCVSANIFCLYSV